LSATHYANVFCDSKNFVYFLMITVEQPALDNHTHHEGNSSDEGDEVTEIVFKIVADDDFESLNRYSNAYLSTQIVYEPTKNQSLTWEPLTKCISYNDQNQCNATQALSGVNYTIYYHLEEEQLSNGTLVSVSGSDANLAVQCGFSQHNDIVMMNTSLRMDQNVTQFSAPVNGTYVVNVVATFDDDIVAVRSLYHLSVVLPTSYYYSPIKIQYLGAPSPVVPVPSPSPLPSPSPSPSPVPSPSASNSTPAEPSPVPSNSSTPTPIPTLSEVVASSSAGGFWNPLPRGTKGLLIGLLAGGILSCMLTCMFIFCAVYMINYHRRNGYRPMNPESPATEMPTTAL